MEKIVKQWNGIKETNTATGSDKEWQKKKKKKKKKAETTGASLSVLKVRYLTLRLVSSRSNISSHFQKMSVFSRLLFLLSEIKNIARRKIAAGC